MFTLHILSLPSFQIDKKRVNAIVHAIDEEVERSQKGNVNIAFLSDEEIQVLNARYRQKNQSTDVLSFHYLDDFSTAHAGETVGEIVMSMSRIQSQAFDHGHSEMTEFEILLIHSLLHLLGFDHESEEDFQKMWKIEQGLQKKFSLISPHAR